MINTTQVLEEAKVLLQKGISNEEIAKIIAISSDSLSEYQDILDLVEAEATESLAIEPITIENDVDIEEAKYYEGSDALKEFASPERLLMKDQMSKVIFDTLDKLPEELKMAISLRELDGMSYEDIANIMDCPVGTVRSRIFRAREAIDKQLQPLLEK